MKTPKLIQHLLKLLKDKQEIRLRLSQGENIKDLLKEKGIKIVQPI